MPLKNKIINYFVAQTEKGKMPKVFLSPVTMPTESGKQLLIQQLKKNNQSIPIGDILHVCYDLDSERIYLPNANLFTKEKKEYLLKAAEIRIAKDFGSVLNVKPIEGSPFSSLRVRSISSFKEVVSTIKDKFTDTPFYDLPVLEVNLAVMPTTLSKELPPYFSGPNFTGGYISITQKPYVNFIDEIDLNGNKRETPILLLQQKTPFILINISASMKVSASDKERIVLFGYRDYIYDQIIKKNNGEYDQKEVAKATDFADLHAAKRFMYLGYPFEEVCSVLLDSSRNFGELYNGIQRLMIAAEEMAKDGYTNPAGIPYYMTFKIDPKTFPFDFSSIAKDESTFHPSKQLPYFMIIEYDRETNYILIQTPAFIKTDLCSKILKAKNSPLITHYNPLLNKIDVKSPDGVFQEYKMQGEQLGKVNALTKHQVSSDFPEKANAKIEYRTDKRAQGISLSNPDICNVRKISDYYYACDKIKKMCQKRDIPFVDLTVVIGPLARIFGQGTAGGFMSHKMFTLSKLPIPFEIENGLFVSPPIIAVDSVSMPGYDQQTATLVHEYAHNLFNISNPSYEHQYNKEENMNMKKSDPNRWWHMYLEDIDERQAHREEIKHELESGYSPDEIIRDKIGGKVTLENYPIALKFKELVDEIMKEIEQEEKENEKPNEKSA